MATRPAVFKGQARTKQQRDKDHDVRRGSAAKRGYDSKWSRAAALFKADHPLCLGCRALGYVEPTTLVDHIIPHGGDLKLFWRRSNWQPACTWHHNVIKQKLENRWRRRQGTDADLRLDSPAAMALTAQWKSDIRGV